MPATVEKQEVTHSNCQYHCVGCDQHFASLSSFDKHRRGKPSEKRRCVSAATVRDSEGEPRLEVKTSNGNCKLQTFNGEGLDLQPVVIWTDYGSAESTKRLVASGVWKRPPASEPQARTRGGKPRK